MLKPDDVFSQPLNIAGIEPEAKDAREAIRLINSYLARAAVQAAYIKAKPGDFQEFTCHLKAMCRVNEKDEVEVTGLVVGVF